MIFSLLPWIDRMSWVLVVHGGAGAIPSELADESEYRLALRRATEAGTAVLASSTASPSPPSSSGLSSAPAGITWALRACLATVACLEDCPLFNAGRGSVLTSAGTVEMEAAVMEAARAAPSRAGAVTGVRTARNPIVLASHVMCATPHVFLGHPGSERFAEEVGVPREDPSYFVVPKRAAQLAACQAESIIVGDHGGELERGPAFSGASSAVPVSASTEVRGEEGTVGAVAIAPDGSIACATSTGGRTNKMESRIGDTPCVGAGSFVSTRSHVAVSGTGIGEAFLRASACSAVCHAVEFGGLSLRDAAAHVVHERLAPGDGGVICCRGDPVAGDKLEIVWDLNTPGMFRASASSDAPDPVVRIWKVEDEEAGSATGSGRGK